MALLKSLAVEPAWCQVLSGDRWPLAGPVPHPVGPAALSWHGVRLPAAQGPGWRLGVQAGVSEACGDGGGVAESTAPSCLPSPAFWAFLILTKRNSLARNQKGLKLKPALGSEKMHPRLYQATPQLPQDPGFSVSKTSSPPTTSGIRDLQKCI